MYILLLIIFIFSLPRPPQMAELLQRLNNTQERLRPYLERYCMLTLLDPLLPPGVSRLKASASTIKYKLIEISLL